MAVARHKAVFVFEPPAWCQHLNIECASPAARERLERIFHQQSEHAEQQEGQQREMQKLPTSFELLRDRLASRQGEIISLRSKDLEGGVADCSDWMAGASARWRACVGGAPDEVVPSYSDEQPRTWRGRAWRHG